jgi:periplasmic divalent cation tolerance protein
VSDAPSLRGVLAVLSTVPDHEIAERIGTTLVEEGLAACANILGGVTSIFRWKGGVEREAEVMMVLKTTSDVVERMRLRLVELHPYEVPEVLALAVQDGHEPYLEWVRSMVGRDV